MEYTDIILGRHRQDLAESPVYYARTVAPTVEPISLDDAVRHLQLAAGGDNGYISALIAVARDVTEKATGAALLPQTWVASTGDWPRCRMLMLAMAPITAISSVKYYAEGETTLTTLDPSNYVFASRTMPATLVFNDDFDGPDLAKRPDAIEVTFTAGYANAAAVDPSLKHAVRILLRHYYDNPEAAATGNFSELPFSLRHLLQQQRVSGWVA